MALSISIGMPGSAARGVDVDTGPGTSRGGISAGILVGILRVGIRYRYQSCWKYSENKDAEILMEYRGREVRKDVEREIENSTEVTWWRISERPNWPSGPSLLLRHYGFKTNQRQRGWWSYCAPSASGVLMNPWQKFRIGSNRRNPFPQKMSCVPDSLRNFSGKCVLKWYTVQYFTRKRTWRHQ